MFLSRVYVLMFYLTATALEELEGAGGQTQTSPVTTLSYSIYLFWHHPHHTFYDTSFPPRMNAAK